MSELYQITEIGGKGRGVVASKFIKKGTLILKERPQIPPIEIPEDVLNEVETMRNMHKCISNPEMKSKLEGFVRNVVSFFYQMKESEQKEYLNLRSKKLDGLKEFIMMMEKDLGKAEKTMKIVGTFLSNFARPDGFRIRSSLFNHSCHPNATEIWSPVSSTKVTHEIRAIFDIEPGQEIAFNYVRDDFPGMRKKEVRQKIIFLRHDFICLCNLCQDGDDDDHTGSQSQIEELIEEWKKLNYARQKRPVSAWIGDISCITEYRRDLACLKQLYKLGKEKKSHPECLFKILELGYHAASFGYFLSRNSKQQELSEAFEIEAVNFAKTAEKFGKILGKEYVEPEMWRKIHQNFREMVFHRY